MKCVGCGASIYEDINRCQYCGAYQSVAQSVPQPQQAPPQPIVIHNVIHNTPQTVGDERGRVSISGKSRWAALLLCIFFGYLGVHKFYVGKTGAGILYLLTFGLFGIGWFLDTVFILFGSFTDKWGRPLKQ